MTYLPTARVTLSPQANIEPGSGPLSATAFFEDSLSELRAPPAECFKGSRTPIFEGSRTALGVYGFGIGQRVLGFVSMGQKCGHT